MTPDFIKGLFWLKIIQLDYINAAFSHVAQTTNSDVITVDLGTEHLRMTGLPYSKWNRSSDYSQDSKGPHGNYLDVHIEQVLDFIR